MTDVQAWILAGTEAIALPCLVHLWWRRDSTLVRKLVWAVVLVVPVFGPIFYGAVFQPLKPTPEMERARETPGVRLGWWNR